MVKKNKKEVKEEKDKKAQENLERRLMFSEIKRSGLSYPELKTLLKGASGSPSKKRTFKHYYAPNHIKIGVFSDAHIGQEMFDEMLFERMGKTFRKEKVDAVYQVGDILEGMSGRGGQVYELTHIGYKNQMKYAVKLFNSFLSGLKIFGIDGNHDAWYKEKGDIGAVVGEDLDKLVSNYTHLGEMEADVKFSSRITMKLFHPNDGTAYATSYKLQKLIESFSGGEKPSILLEGHYHKALYMFHRNIHALECGTLSGQTVWMRGKKIPAHKGFWILDIWYNKSGVQKFAPEFFPEYIE
jgi:predicted phosphodiesterase